LRLQFGAKFVVLKIAAEMNESIHYHLCTMMGIRIDGESNIFADNKSVVDNMTIPKSTLSKKHSSIPYHKCQECVASHAMQVAHEPGLDNLADGLTKFLARFKFLTFIQQFLYQRKSNSIDENDE
jgi:hypothetical protein